MTNITLSPYILFLISLIFFFYISTKWKDDLFLMASLLCNMFVVIFILADNSHHALSVIMSYSTVLVIFSVFLKKNIFDIKKDKK